MSIGYYLVLAGLLMPLFVNVNNFEIYETLTQAIREQEKMYIIIAALKLVALNSIRSIPHYLGAFFIGESITLVYKGKRVGWFRAVIVFCVIYPVYLLIEKIYHIRYDFGVPAVLLIVLLIALEKADFSLVNIPKKGLMVVMLVASVQFLDVMPMLSGFPFGRGETSNEIKRASTFLGADSFLQLTAVVFFVLLFFNSILLCMLIMDENNLKTLNELKEQNERMMTEKRMRALENRTYFEMQHLVHDLKSPLTSAQALVGVVKLGSERDGRDRDYEYLTKIEASVEQMSNMISEILHESVQSEMPTEKIVTALLAQISIAEYAPLVSTRNMVPKQTVLVNKIRFLRALVNLIENSYYAIDPQKGKIWLEVDQAEFHGAEYIRFQISDNGCGIPAELLDSIWERGFSTRSSHGLGLSFVKSVVTGNGGEIEITVMPKKQGTVVAIYLPKGGGTDESGD